MGNLSLETTRLKNVQLQIAICKLNEKLQREQEGRAGEEYTRTPCHSNPRLPVPQNNNLLCAPFGGVPMWKSLFLTVTGIRIVSTYI